MPAKSGIFSFPLGRATYAGHGTRDTGTSMDLPCPRCRVSGKDKEVSLSKVSEEGRPRHVPGLAPFCSLSPLQLDRDGLQLCSSRDSIILLEMVYMHPSSTDSTTFSLKRPFQQTNSYSCRGISA